MRWRWALRATFVVAVTLSPLLGRAQTDPAGRPSEDELFGASAGEETAGGEPLPEAPAASDVDAPAPPPPTSRDDLILGDPTAGPRLSADAAPSDPLTIGGAVYLRAWARGQDGQGPQDYRFTTPTLTDIYLDARPNPRVRAFAQGRMSFDPTQPEVGVAGAPARDVAGSNVGSTDLSGVFGGSSRGPFVVLDQLWLNFDIARRVFVTAGRQHVRWGTARFWMPTDYLHIQRRNPLDVFDARTGTTMVKVHVPWEERGWNFYGFAVTENTTPTGTVGDIAGALRAQVVLETTELSAGAFLRRGDKPKWAFDVSTALGDFDLYGELALRYGSEIDRVAYERNAVRPPNAACGVSGMGGGFDLASCQRLIDAYFPVFRDSDIKPQAVGGFTWQRKYNDNDVISVGLEYFYNGLGYSDPSAYLGLILPHSFPLRETAIPFYLGRHYAAVFVALPAPYSWNYTTISVSTLSNLSDQSFISRIDYLVTVLTHLQFQAFAAVHYGRREGEFRFGIRFEDVNIQPSLLDLGVALRLPI